MPTKWRNPMRKTLPVQFMEILNRLDELEIKGSGFGGSSVGAGLGEDHADVSPNLIRNPGFEDWTLTVCDFWQSAEDNDWAAVAQHYAQETTFVYSLPYSVKLGDGVNGSRGIAQESAFRVVPGESYYVSVRLIGGDATVEYAVILKALEVDGVTEITTGTPLGTNWTYSAAFGGWIITGIAGTDWNRVTAPVTLAPDAVAEDVYYLRASIQYYQNGTVKYLYADDFAITRGSQLPAFSYYYLTEPSEPDVHKLLSLTHSDTLTADVVAGDMIFGNATPKWTRLAKGDNGDVLTLVLGLPSWEPPSGGTPHKLLSATHTDALPDDVHAGDLLYGNSTPAWARLPKNASGELLYMLGSLPAWGLGPSSGALLYGLSGSSWGKLVAGTAGYILTMYGGYPAWRPAPTPGVSGSGTIGYIPKWVGSAALGNSILYESGGVIYISGGISVNGNAYVVGGLSATSDIVTSANFGCVIGRHAMTDLVKTSAASAPTSAYVRLYAKTDNKLYYKDYLGFETGPLGVGGAGGGVDGSGTVGYIPVWTATSTLGNSILQQVPSGIYTVLGGYRMNLMAPISWMGPALQPDYYGIVGTYAGSALRLWSTYSNWEFKNANADLGGDIWKLTGSYIQFPDGTRQYTAGGTGAGGGSFSCCVPILVPTGAIYVMVWRALFACTVTAVRGYRVGGSGATVNARKNGSLNHLSSPLSLTSADTWMVGAAPQNTTYAEGDKFEVFIASATGSPAQVGIQVDFIKG